MINLSKPSKNLWIYIISSRISLTKKGTETMAMMMMKKIIIKKKKNLSLSHFKDKE